MQNGFPYLPLTVAEFSSQKTEVYKNFNKIVGSNWKNETLFLCRLGKS